MDDWRDDVARERSAGIIRPLLQSAHAAVNAKYFGCTDEHCCVCGGCTGNAGRGDGSLYVEDDGPFCSACYEEVSHD